MRSNNFVHWTLLLSLLFVVDSWGQTGEYLRAPILPAGRGLPIQLSASGKEIEWATASNVDPLPINKGELVLARRGFKIGYVKYNPLKIAVAVSVKDFDDPAQAALLQLFEGLGTVAKNLSPATNKNERKNLDSCTKKTPLEVACLKSVVVSAQKYLEESRFQAVHWSSDIDGGWKVIGTNGPTVLSNTRRNMDETAQSLQEDAKLLSELKLENMRVSTGEDVLLLRSLKNLIEQESTFASSIEKLAAAVKEDEGSAHWDNQGGTLFLLDPAIDPTKETGKEVTVSVTQMILKPVKDTYVLEKQEPITQTFKVRKYRVLLPEIGTGVVLGYIDRPKYGTGTNAAGATVVTLSSTDHVSVDGALMGNFVSHWNAGGIAPMLQIGANVSKDLPGILLGMGLRLVGLPKGDIGIGGGLLLGWYRDLGKLKVGDVVTGSAAIDADLGFRTTPTPAPYLNIQYKF